MKEDIITLNDLLAIFKRYILSTILLIILGASIGVGISFYIPKKFKTKAILNIQSSYFKNPLVSDLIPENTDPGELNTQRASLLRLSLSDEFLDSLGEKYNLFKSVPDSLMRTVERESLLKKIEYFSLSSTTFQISIAGNTPKEVYNMLKDVLDQMTYTLIEERYKLIVRARDAIQNQVEFMSRVNKESTSFTSSNTDKLKSELQKIDSNISELKTKYTESHPELFKLKQQAETVRRRIKESALKSVKAPSMGDTDDMAKAFLTRNSQAPISDIYNDLLKKLNYLGIVLEMEKDREKVTYLGIIEKPNIPLIPYFPDKKLFGIFGVVGGLVLSIILSLFRELKKVSNITPEKAAEMLGVKFFGNMPELGTKENQLLLEGPVRKVSTDLIGFSNAIDKK